MFQGVFVMLVVSVIAFCMFRFVGDPVQMMLGDEQSEAARQHIREQLGLNDPVVVQFGRFVSRAVRGDLGYSYRSRQSVAALIGERLPATLELVACAGLLASLLGLPMGIYAAMRRNGVLSRVFQGVALAGLSMPTFLTGLLLIMMFSVKLQWLPAFGRGEVVAFGWWDTGLLTGSGIRSLVLPAVALAWFQTAVLVRLVRSEMLSVLQSDFVRFAQARGLPARTVYLNHALRNAVVPVVTVGGLQFGTLVAFSIVTEVVFQWPGAGMLFVQSVTYADIPVMSGYLLFVALLFVLVNLVVDLLYLAIDPRMRPPSAEGGSAA
jgi:peptide/nickel transport system permease protein